MVISIFLKSCLTSLHSLSLFCFLSFPLFYFFSFIFLLSTTLSHYPSFLETGRLLSEFFHSSVIHHPFPNLLYYVTSDYSHIYSFLSSALRIFFTISCPILKWFHVTSKPQIFLCITSLLFHLVSTNIFLPIYSSFEISSFIPTLTP